MMESKELVEAAERAHEPHEKRIGLTMAVVAVLLACCTMLGHRTHTEEVVLQTRAADQWAYYQAKNNRSQMYGADAKLAALLGHNGLQQAAEFRRAAAEQKKGAGEVRKEAEGLEHDTVGTAHKAKYFDISEVLLEISIVLCSITLLTRSAIFWRLSFVSTAAGAVLGSVAALR